MIDTYAKLIIKGRKTIDDVPEDLREAVEEAIKKLQPEENR